jgi:hypothetical protein
MQAQALEELEGNDTNKKRRVLHRHLRQIEIGTKRESMFQERLLRRSWIIFWRSKRVNRAPVSQQPGLACYNCFRRTEPIRSRCSLVVGVLGIEIAKKILAL